MIASEERPGLPKRLVAIFGLLAWSTVSSAATWIAFGGGGTLGYPGTRHGINVGGLAPVSSGGLAVLQLLYPDPIGPSSLNADLYVQADGPLIVDTEQRRVLVALTAGTNGPDAVGDGTVQITVTPAPVSVSWTCSGAGAQCPAAGDGAFIDGIALADNESVSIEFTIGFDTILPMRDVQLGALIDSELADPLPMDNSLTLRWTDVLFSAGFESSERVSSTALGASP